MQTPPSPPSNPIPTGKKTKEKEKPFLNSVWIKLKL
jgi:hypothetical protein